MRQRLRPNAVLAGIWLLLSLLSSALAQNIIDTGEQDVVAPPLQLASSQVDAVVGRVLAPGKVVGSEARRVASKLDNHVNELLRGWPWRPFHHTLGISGYEAYFNHPDELFYVLALALPYLEPARAAQVKAFLRQQLSLSPPYALAGWDNQTGQPRESYDVPNRLRLPGQGKATSAFGVYAFWAWCHYAHDSAAAQSRWPAVRARMQPLLAADYRFDCRKTDYTRDEAQKLNGDLAGLIGLVRLARLNSDAETTQAARRRLGQVLELRVNLERVNPRVIEKTSASKSLHVYKLARYCDLVPEVGQALCQLSDGCGAARLKSFREQRNGWYLAFGDRFIGGENYTSPLHFSRSMFTGAAFIEQLPADALLRFLDVPWCRGDFYFIEKCVVALWAASGSHWADWEGTRK